MVDVGDIDPPPLVIDAVDDAVAASARRSQAGERAGQGTAQPMRLFSQSPEDQLHARGADLFGEA